MAGNFRSRVCLALLALSVVGTAFAQSPSPTRTRLISHSYPSAAGAPVTLRAEVDGLGSGAPSRAFVTFYDGPNRLGLGRSIVPGAGQDTLSASYQSCALTSAGGVRCWGNNNHGQLGDGTTTDRSTPVDVSGLTSGVIAVSAGVSHSCALTSAGGVKCWGYNIGGALGDGTLTERLTPVDVSWLTRGVLAISVGDEYSCAVTRVGGVKCWGVNISGRLGVGDPHSHRNPLDVVGLTSGAVAVMAGRNHTCALTSAGGVKCWGGSPYGAIGDGTTILRPTPVDVIGLTSGVVAITVGGYHTCALTSAGGVKCWGLNRYGQLGDGTTEPRLTPVDVVGLMSGVVAVSAGMEHTCALTSSGSVGCWGLNLVGALGDSVGKFKLTPFFPRGLTDVVAVKASSTYHSCALTGLGVVKCWGSNGNGELGDGTTINRSRPVITTNLTAVVRARAYFTTGPLASGLHVMRAFYTDDARHSGSSAGFGQTVQ